jgi:hypothetical protein
MVEQGLRDGQLKGVRGFADTDLRYHDAPLDPRNRRISIVVRSQMATELDNLVRDGKSSQDPPAGAAAKAPAPTAGS